MNNLDFNLSAMEDMNITKHHRAKQNKIYNNEGQEKKETYKKVLVQGENVLIRTFLDNLTNYEGEKIPSKYHMTWSQQLERGNHIGQRNKSIPQSIRKAIGQKNQRRKFTALLLLDNHFFFFCSNAFYF